MSDTLRFVLIISSVFTTMYVLRKLGKSQMSMEDTLFWFLGSFSLIIISIFPNIVDFFSNIVGVDSSINFLFLVVCFFLLIKNFLLSLKIRKVENKLSEFVQVYALKDEVDNIRNI